MSETEQAQEAVDVIRNVRSGFNTLEPVFRNQLDEALDDNPVALESLLLARDVIHAAIRAQGADPAQP